MRTFSDDFLASKLGCALYPCSRLATCFFSEHNSLISRPIFDIFTVLEMADHALSKAYLFVQIGREMSELHAAAHIHAVVEPQNAVYCIMFP